MNKKKCRAEICLATIFSTQALFTPVKTLFLLHFMMQTQDISFLKFVFTFASFVFELPSGYFSDKVGNKICLVCSRFLMIMSLLAYFVLSVQKLWVGKRCGWLVFFDFVQIVWGWIQFVENNNKEDFLLVQLYIDGH